LTTHPPYLPSFPTRRSSDLPDPDSAYFADGLTEEIITDLSRVEALRVISRQSAMRFRGTDKALREVARELNVRYVVTGAVRKAGDRKSTRLNSSHVKISYAV